MPKDCDGRDVFVGTLVRVLQLSGRWLDDLPNDERSRVLSMVGETFRVHEIDQNGSPWVVKVWSGEMPDTRMSHDVTLAADEMLVVDGNDAADEMLVVDANAKEALPVRAYFASPNGTALTLSLKTQAATIPSHGMYRAEIDARQHAAERTVSSLLLAFLSRMPNVAGMVLCVHAGPRIEFGTDLVVVADGENKNAVYSVMGEISANALDVLTSLQYGEFFVLGFANAGDLPDLPSLADLDNTMATLSGSTQWAVGYDNESAVATVLVREEDVVKRVVIDVLESRLSTLQLLA